MPLPPDTIFALTSGVGRAAIAVVRISGPSTRACLERLARGVPAPRVATLRALRDTSGDILDHGLVLWFPAPASFTGDDSAELQVHGGRAVVAALLDALAAMPGCRPAAPGEFTRRAFLNGKMTLGAAEGVIDLVEAETEAQRRQALRALDGALGRWTAPLRDDLLAALALAEGAIDFAEDDDLVGTFRAETDGLIGRVATLIEGELVRGRRTVSQMLTDPPPVSCSSSKRKV